MTPPDPQPDSATFRADELLEHAAWIRRLARRLVGDAADDLVQETWVAALKQKPSPGRSLRPWLAAVARNLARTRRRGSARRHEREVTAARVESLPSADELVERGEQQRAVVDAVLALDEPHRSALLLRYYEGLEPREIAERQGVPGATVRSWLKRGVERVRERLDATHGGDRERWVKGLLPLAGLREEAVVAAGGGALVTTGIGVLAMNVTLKLAALLAAVGLIWMGLEEARTEVPSLDVPRPGSTAPSQVALAPEGEALTPRRTAPQEGGAVGAPLVSAGVAPARVTARVVDGATGEPLAHYLVGVTTEDPHEDGPFGPASVAPDLVATTDADGVFVTPKALPPGKVWVLPRDRRGEFDLRYSLGQGIPSLEVGVELAHPTPAGQPAPDVSFATGPTYSLATHLPEGRGVEDFFATLETDLTDLDTATRLRAGDLPWVRFLPLRSMSGEGGRNSLNLRSRDGRWAGSARVDGIQGVQRTPVVIELAPTARLHGEVVDAAGSAVEDVEVFLWPGERELDELGWGELREYERHDVDPDRGGFDYRWIAPGTYTLRVQSDRWRSTQQRVEVTTDGLELDVQLEPRAQLRDRTLRGRVTSDTGQFHDRVRAAIFPVESRVRYAIPVRAEVVWEQIEGRWIGSFEASELEDRVYVVSLSGFDELGNTSWLERAVTPTRVRQRPDDGMLHFVVQDSVAAVDVSVRVVDARTRAPIEAFTASFHVMDAQVPLAHRQVFEGLAQFDAMAVPERRRGHVHAAGYRPLHLDEGCLPSGGGPVTFELHAGWGATVGVWDVESEPVAGASVIVDGVDAGRTDLHGSLRLEGDAAPAKVRVEHPDYRLERALDVDPETNELLPNSRESGESLIFVLARRGG